MPNSNYINIPIIVPDSKCKLNVYAIAKQGDKCSEMASREYTVNCLSSPCATLDKDKRKINVQRGAGSESADIICYTTSEKLEKLKETDQNIVAAIYEKEKSKDEKEKKRFIKFQNDGKSDYIVDVKWKDFDAGDELYFYAFATEDGHVSKIVRHVYNWLWLR